MNVSETSVVERVARVLAGCNLSANGAGSLKTCGRAVDEQWPAYEDMAKAVLRALREPDRDMAAAGDSEMWADMVCAGLGEHAPLRRRLPVEGIYQKPLG